MSASETNLLFSIVTVCMNDKEGLIRTRKSIRSQTNTNYEWLVIDGASKDGTKEFLVQLPRDECQWLSEPDKGLYDAMNKGIEKAVGQYLLFLNSGDEFATVDVLQDVSNIVSSNCQPDFIYGDSLERSENGLLIYKAARSCKHLWYGMFTHHQSMFYKKETVGLLRYQVAYPIGADYGLTAALLRKSVAVFHFSGAVCIFERGGISEKNIAQGAIDQFAIRREILRYPYLVCLLIKYMHAAVRVFKKIAPAFHQSLRFSKNIRS